MDALEALGIMAGSRNARPAHQEELFDLFDGIVSVQARTGMGVRKRTDEGTVFEFGREIEFDIRVVPAAVKGLERICVSEQAPPALRAKIVKRLLTLWDGVSNIRVIWGPSAVEALISAMCSAACSPRATVAMKTRLGTSLLRFLNKLSVVRSIGRVFGQPDTTVQMRELALRAGREVLDEWEACDLQDEERRLALLDSAARIAANNALYAHDEEVGRLRERTIQALFSALREGILEVQDPLRMLRDCPDLPEQLRQEIDERLGKAFALVASRAT
jgi:hypothetical protein